MSDPDPRASLRSVVRPLLGAWWRWLLGFAVTVALLAGAPSIAHALEDRGLPGPPIALAAVFALAAATLWAYRSTFPGSRRRASRMRWASEHGAPFRSDFTLPASMSDIPSMNGLGSEGGVAHLVVLRRQDEEVMVFDRWRATAPGYEDAEWRTAAAVRTHLEAPCVVIHPRHHRFRGSEFEVDLQPLGTESTDFERRYRVVAGDRAAAATVVDARMMAWLLDRPTDATYESAGHWVVCSIPAAGSDELDRLVEGVVGFRDHLPRVLDSLYPAPDPGLGLN